METNDFIKEMKVLTCEQTKDALALKKVRDFLVEQFSTIAIELKKETTYAGVEINIVDQEPSQFRIEQIFANVGFSVSGKIGTDILSSIREGIAEQEIRIKATYYYRHGTNVIKDEYGWITLESAKPSVMPEIIDDVISVENGICKLRSSGEPFRWNTIEFAIS